MAHRRKGFFRSLFSNDETRVNVGAVAILFTVLTAGLSLAIYQFWYQKEMPNQEIVKWSLITGASAYLGTKAEKAVELVKTKVKEKLNLPDLGGAGGGTPPEA